MKLYFFNDTDKDMKVYTKDFHEEPIILKSGRGNVFEIADAPETLMPFVKVWDKTALISWI